MIGKRHPEAKENLEDLRKNGAVLLFATDAKMLYAREGERWFALGHVAPLSGTRMSKPIPRLQGKPFTGVRLMGVRD